MEANVSVNIRMKPELKRQFKIFCTDMGLSMTEAFNLLAQKAVNEYKCRCWDKMIMFYLLKISRSLLVS